MATIISIYRAEASELYVPFKDRVQAYLWACKYIDKWCRNPEYNGYEARDTSKWGSFIAADCYYEIFAFTKKPIQEYRRDEWYDKHDLGFHCLAAEYAFELGMSGEPCNCEDPCIH